MEAVAMQTSVVKLIAINKELALLPENKLDEVKDFIGFILAKEQGKKKKAIQLKGIWRDKGFEKLNLGKELLTARAEMSATLLKKGI